MPTILNLLFMKKFNAALCISFLFIAKLKAGDTCFTFNYLKITGNKKTREQVFLRELGLKKGEQVCEIKQKTGLWQNRISSLSLFNKVELYTLADTLVINVVERLYIWGYPEFSIGDRNWNVFLSDPAWNRLTYGLFASWKNILGLNHTAELSANTGYNNFVSLSYKIPFSKFSSGYSLQFKYSHLTNHEVWYQTLNNKLQFFHLTNHPAQQYNAFSVKLQKRFNYYNSLSVYAGRMHQRVDSAVMGYKGNPEYFATGNLQNTLYAGIEFISDHRNQRDYPVSGYYLITRIQPQEMRNRLVNNGLNMEYYFKFNWFTPLKKRLVWVKSLTGRATTGYLPYNSRRQLGYGQEYVRGYEPYVADGNRFVLGKTALRYALLNNRDVKLKKWMVPLKNYRTIPFSVWFSIFADAGKTNRSPIVNGNTLSQTWLRSTGLGTDLLFAYNSMMRMEYSINHFGQGQFNLAFTNAF